MVLRPDDPTKVANFDGLGHDGHGDGNPALSQLGTILRAKIVNNINEGLVRAAEAAGLTPADDYNQITQLIRKLGSVNARGVRKNLLLNSDMAVWQRLVVSPPSQAINNAVYVADRWRCEPGGGGAATIARGTLSPGSSPLGASGPFTLIWQQTTGGTNGPNLQQRLEGVESYDAQTLTLSVPLKVGTGTLTVTPKIRQDFGVGGSASVETSGAAFTVTTTTTRFSVAIAVPSISGKTIGTNPYTSFMLQFPDSTTFTLTVMAAQLEFGSEMTDYQVPDPATEMPALFRYCWKTYDRETPLATVTEVGAVHSDDAGTGIHGLLRHFPVEMRALPTLTFFSPRTGTTGRVERPPGADAVVSSVTQASTRQTGVPTTSAVSAGNALMHLLAEAEL